MKLFIPTIGTTIKLTENWSFTLYGEYRNEKFWKEFSGPNDKTDFWRYRGSMATMNIILPAETILVIDRMYIRKNLKNFDSITFRLKNCDVLKIKNKRFWAKLDDVNKIECEVIDGT